MTIIGYEETEMTREFWFEPKLLIDGKTLTLVLANCVATYALI